MKSGRAAEADAATAGAAVDTTVAAVMPSSEVSAMTEPAIRVFICASNVAGCLMTVTPRAGCV